MTFEEAKKIFLDRGIVEVEGGAIFDGDKWRQACYDISQWLKQQPCNDAISRQEAIKLGYELPVDYDHYLQSWRVVDVGDIRRLPPVIPQPKIGHWIFVDEAHEHARCSGCDYGVIDLMDGKPHNYCQNCGHQMKIEE